MKRSVKLIFSCFLFMSLLFNQLSYNKFVYANEDLSSTKNQSDDNSNNIEPAANLLIGEEMAGRLDFAGDTDCFVFVPSVSGYYSFEGNGSHELVGTLFDDQKNHITFGVSSGLGSNFHIFGYLESGKKYYLYVHDYNAEPGTYVVKASALIDDYRNEFENATFKNVGECVKGSIDYLGDCDVIKFTTLEAGYYVIETSGSMDLTGMLLNEDQTSVALYYQQDISPTNKNIRVYAKLEANKTYCFSILHDYQEFDIPETGDYALEISTEADDHGDSIASSTVISVDTEVNGNINGLNDIDCFKFVPSSSGYYEIESSGSTNVDGRLYNDQNKNFATDSNSGINSNFNIISYLEANKTYYLMVYHSSFSGAGEYKVKISPLIDDHRDEYDNASQINVGDNVNAKINYTGDYDIFKFTPKTTGPYIIQSSGDTDLACDLKNATGTSKISCYIQNDISDSNKNFKILTTLDSNTTYYLCIYHNNGWDKDTPGIGDYNFNIIQGTDDYGNSPESANSIQIGHEISGEIETGKDIDYFKFTPSKSGYYGIESSGSSNVDGLLYDHQNKLLVENSFAGKDDNFYLTKYLTANNIYYIAIENHNDNMIGKYNVKVSDLTDDFMNDRSVCSSVYDSVYIPCEINYPCDLDVFKFVPKVTGPYFIRSLGTTDTYGYIENSNGSHIASSSNYINGDLNFGISYMLNANQTYYINISHENSIDLDSAGVGKYTLYISPVTDDYGDTFENSSPISINKEISGSIDFFRDNDYFRFTTADSGTYTFETDGVTNVDGFLFDQTQLLIKYDSMSPISNNNFKYNLSANSVYYLKINHSNNNYFGSYKFRIYKDSDDYSNQMSYASLIKTDSVVIGKINYTGDIDWLRFTVPSEGLYTVSSSEGTNLYGELYDSSKKLIGFNSSESSNLSIIQTLKTNRYYYLKIRHNDLENGFGTYALKVSSSGDTNVIIGDINNDNHVNMLDVLILAKSFGSTTINVLFDRRCDLSGDGVVDMMDVLILAKNFGIKKLGTENKLQEQGEYTINAVLYTFSALML